MSKYIGIPCPICNKTFVEGDDLVVCPICGTPYHRHCYKVNDKCINDELHESGKSWEAPEIKINTTSTSYEIKDQECPSCGVLNAHSALFCSSCGSALKIKPDVHNNRTSDSNQFHIGSMLNSAFDPLAGIPATEILDQDITFGEVSKVVQQNTRYYMPAFSKVKNTKKSGFNLSAFIFTGGWLLFRKQYKSGILLSVLMFLLFLLQSLTTLYISFPRITELFKEMGMEISSAGVTMEQMLSFASYSNISAIDLLIISLPSIVSLLMFVVMLIMGFNANKMYMKHCVKTINSVREKSTTLEDYNLRISEKGGIDIPVTICLVICYFIVSYLPAFL